MKRTVYFLWVISLCAGLSQPLCAQSEFTGGLLAGPVTSQVSGDGLGGWDKFGGTAGGWVHMTFSDHYGMTFAIQYIMKGSRKPADPNNGDFNTFAYRLNYIDVPIMLSYRRAAARAPLQFNAGLYAGVLVGQEQLYNGATTGIEPPFNQTDFGATGGITWWLSEKLNLELRGTTSVLPSRNSPNPTNAWSYYEQGNYNQTLMLLLGLRF